MLSIVPQDRAWVTAYFMGSQITHPRAGQTVTMTADVYGCSPTLAGHVLGLDAGTGSTFALLHTLEFLQSGMSAFAADPIMDDNSASPEQFSIANAAYATMAVATIAKLR